MGWDKNGWVPEPSRVILQKTSNSTESNCSPTWSRVIPILHLLAWLNYYVASGVQFNLVCVRLIPLWGKRMRSVIRQQQHSTFSTLPWMWNSLGVLILLPEEAETRDSDESKGGVKQDQNQQETQDFKLSRHGCANWGQTTLQKYNQNTKYNLSPRAHPSPLENSDFFCSKISPWCT